MTAGADDTAGKWARLDRLWQRMHAARRDAGSDAADVVKRAVLAQERADGLFDMSLASLPPDRLVTAQTLIAELQQNVCVIVDANIRAFTHGRRLALILLPPTDQATTVDASQAGTPRPVSAPQDKPVTAPAGEKILCN